MGKKSKNKNKNRNSNNNTGAKKIKNWNRARYRLEMIHISGNHTQRDYRLFQRLMDDYLEKHKKSLLSAASITDLFTGEVLHEYIDAIIRIPEDKQKD